MGKQIVTVALVGLLCGVMSRTDKCSWLSHGMRDIVVRMPRATTSLAYGNSMLTPSWRTVQETGTT